MDPFIMAEDIKKEKDETEINFPSWIEVGKEEDDPLDTTTTKIEDFDGADVLHDLVPTLTHFTLPKLELPIEKFHSTEVTRNLVPLVKLEPAAVSQILTDCPIKTEEELNHNIHSTQVTRNLVSLVKPEPATVSHNILTQCPINTEEGLNHVVVKKEVSCPTEKEGNNETLRCGTCTLTFTSLLYLQQHAQHCQNRNNPEPSNSEDCVAISTLENTEEKWYHCGICEYKTKFPAVLEEHLRSHGLLYSHLQDKNIHFTNNIHIHKETLNDVATEKTIGCRLCDFKSSHNLLVQHLLSTHVTETPPRCKFCNFKSDVSSHMLQHMLTVHTVQNSCLVCKVQFLCEIDLANHVVRHIEEETYTCNECQRTFHQKYHITTHVMRYTTESTKPLKYECELCDYETKNKSNYVMHTRTHTGEKPYKCEHCAYSTATKWTLKSHSLTHSDEKPFVCKQCDYKGNTKNKLVIHMRLHSGEKPFACKLCNKSYQCSSYLTKHKEVHDKNRIHLCEICGIFRRKKCFSRHIRSHVQKPYCCDICGYTNINEKLIIRHRSLHTGDNSYSCDSCNYKTHLKMNLVSHMKSRHIKEKPFKCEFCEYKTNRSDNLRKHISIHNGDKPYLCRICNYKSANQSNLLTHLKMHKRKNEK